jgi:hypothetical protein
MANCCAPHSLQVRRLDQLCTHSVAQHQLSKGYPSSSRLVLPGVSKVPTYRRSNYVSQFACHVVLNVIVYALASITSQHC